MSKRQKIVDAIIARMQTIKTVDGFLTNIGENVRDYETNWQTEEMPGLSVCDLVSDNSSEDYHDGGLQFYEMPVALRIFANARTDAALLRKMIADINTAIGKDVRWKVNEIGLADWTKPMREGIIHDNTNNNFEIAGAEVVILIRYHTKIFNSFE